MGRGKKRQRNSDNIISKHYDSVSISVREPETQKHGSPDSFFASSHVVQIGRSPSPSETDKDKDWWPSVVVHRNANGLCIVALGNTAPPDIVDVNYLTQETPECSQGERRKLVTKALHRGKLDCQTGLVTPTTPLVEVKYNKGGGSYLIPAGVFGFVLEHNPNMSPDLLGKDPLLNGYLAIILPAGPFPPPLLSRGDDEDDDDRKKATLVADHVADEPEVAKPPPR